MAEVASSEIEARPVSSGGGAPAQGANGLATAFIHLNLQLVYGQMT
jgi:hypothetical protein